MSDFDYKSFINKQYLTNTPQSEGTYKDKISSIQKASEEKWNKLPQLTQALQREQDRYEASITGRLGLAPTSGSAYAVNLGGRVVQSAGRVAGNILSGPEAVYGARQALNLNAEDIALYNKMRRGEATDEETAHMFAFDESIGDFGDTRFGRIHDFENTLKNIKDIRSFTDVGEENFYDPQRDRLQKNLSDIYSRFEERQNAEGAGALAGVPRLVTDSVWEFLTNPAASLGLAAENSANIALGMATYGVSLLAELPGEAASQVIEFIDNYKKENNGALPTDAEIKESMGWAIAGASLDTIGDRITGGIAKGAKGAISGARKAASEAAEQSLAKGAAKLLMNNALTRPLKAGVQAGASEFPIGFAQGYTEARAQLEDPTGRDMYESGMLEAMGGSGFAGTAQAGAEVARPVKAVKNVVGAVAEGVRGRAESRSKSATETRQPIAVGNSVAATPTEDLAEEARQQREHREATGNVDGIVDISSEAFDPAEAANNLFTKLNSDTTTPEEKEAVTQRLQKLHSELSTTGTMLWYKSEALTNDNFSTEFDELTQEIQAAIAESGLDPETYLSQNIQDPKVQEYLMKSKVLEEINEELAEIPEADRDAHRAAMVEDITAKTNNLLELTQDIDARYGEYLDATNASTLESEDRTIDEDVDYLASDDSSEMRPLASINAARRIATKIATSPEEFNSESITRLQEQISRDTHIPEELKKVIQDNIANYTERQSFLSEARRNPTISQVVNEALNTGKDAVRKGINQYNADFFEALNQGNVEQAESEISGLRTFSRQQRSKADAFREAFERSEVSKSPVYIKRGERNLWEVLAETPQDVDSSDSNYMYADAKIQGSRLLRDTMEGIATHAANTLSSMQSAIKSAEILTPSNTGRVGIDLSRPEAVAEYFRDFGTPSTRARGLDNLVAEPATVTPTTERKTKSSVVDKVADAVSRSTKAATDAAEQSARPRGARAGAYMTSSGEIVTVPYDIRLSAEGRRKVTDRVNAYNKKAKEAGIRQLKVEDTISKVHLFINAKTEDEKTFAEVLIETILSDKAYRNGKGAFGTPLINYVKEALGVSNLNESIGDNTGEALSTLVENTDKHGVAILDVARALGVPLPIGRDKKTQADYHKWVANNLGIDPKKFIAEALALEESAFAEPAVENEQDTPPKKSYTSFLAPIENAADSLKKIAPLVKELESIEQRINKTTDEDALPALEKEGEILYDSISKDVNEIVDQLIDHLDDLPVNVADGIRDDLFELKDPDNYDMDSSLRDLANVIRAARYIANSNMDLFENDTPAPKKESKPKSESKPVKVNPKDRTGFREYDKDSAANTSISNSVYGKPLDPELTKEESGLATRLNIFGASKAKQEAKDNKAKEEAKATNSVVDLAAKEDIKEKEASTALLNVYSKENVTTDPNIPFNETNPIAETTVQRVFLPSEDGEDAHKLPLATHKNFLSKAIAGMIDWRTFLPKSDKESNPEYVKRQLQGMEGFTAFAKAFAANLDKVLPHGDILPKKHFWHSELYLHLAELDDENRLNFEENIVTALAYAAYSYVAEYSNKMVYNNSEVINKMLGLPKNTRLGRSTAESTSLADQMKHGIFATTMSQSIGTKAVRALGISATSQTGIDIIPRLAGSLGTIATRALVEMEVYDQKYVSKDEFLKGLALTKLNPNNDLYKTTAARAEKGISIIIPRIKKDGDFFKLIETSHAAVTINNSKNSDYVVDKLMTGTRPDVFPSFKPINGVPDKVLNSSMKTSNAQKKVFRKKQKEEPHVLNSEMLTVLDEFLVNEDIFLTMLGYVHDLDSVHIDRRESVRATNADILRNLGYLQDYRGMLREQKDGEKTPFYLKFMPWKNGRAGQLGRINMQGNKFHRYMMYQKSWKREIFLEDTETLDTLMFAIAIGFGANPDTTFKADIVAGLHNDIESDQATIDAIDAIQKILGLKELGNSNRTALLNTISDFVIDKKGGNLSLLALVELGKFEYHFHNPESKSYESVMVDAVDGVTNGPFLYHALHGINAGDQSPQGREAFYKRGGLFKETEERNYVSYRSQGEDNYQDFGRDILKRIDGVEDASTTDAINTILGIFDPFMVKNSDSPDGIETITSKGRNFVKSINSPLTFGSAPKNAVNIMADEFIDVVILRIEGIVNNKELSVKDKKIEMNNFIKSLRSLINKADIEQNARRKEWNEKPILADRFFKNIALDALTLLDKQNRSNRDPLEILNISLSAHLISGLKSAFAHTVGDLVSDSVDTYYSKMRETQDNISNATNAAFYLINGGIKAVLESAYDKYGIGIRNKSTGARDRELSREELNEVLQEHNLELPILNSIWSKGYGESPLSGIHLVKNQKVLSDNSTASVNVHMAPNPKRWKGAKPGARTNTMSGQGLVPWFTAPQLTAVSAHVHSLDSWIIHQTMRDIDAQNNHDEALVSFKDASKTARELNRNTLKALTMYSPSLEVYNTLEHSALIISAMIDKTKESGTAREIRALKASVAESIKEIGYNSRNKFGDFDNLTAGEVFSKVVDHSYLDAYYNTKAKLENLLEYEGGVINQYSNEEGSYEITEFDAEKLREKLDELEDWNNYVLNESEIDGAVENILEFIKKEKTDGRVNTDDLDADFNKLTNTVTVEDPIGETYEAGAPETPEGSNKTAFGKLSTKADPSVNIPLAKLLDKEDLNLGQVLDELVNNSTIRNYSKGSQQKFKAASPLLVFINRLVKDNSLDLSGVRVTKLNRTHKRDDVVHQEGQDISSLEFVGLTTMINDPANYTISKGKSLPDSGEILIKGEHFEEHGIDIEVIAHEVVHAVTALFIHKYPDSPEVKLLTDLMEQVKTELNDTESKVYEYDTSDVFEFVAHALSRPKFMYKLMQTPVSEENLKKYDGFFRSFAATIGSWFVEAITSLFTKQTKKPVPYNVYEAVAAAVSNIIMSPLAETDIESNVSADVLSKVKARNLTPTPRDIIRRLSYGETASKMLKGLNEPNTQRMDVPVLPTVEAELNNLSMREEAPVLRMLSAPFASSQAENASTEYIGTTLTTLLNPDRSNPVIKTGAYRQLIGLYQEAARTITVEDFLPEGVTKAEATKAEIEEAQAQYKALFDKKDNNFLAKFVTLGLTNKAVMDILSKPRQVNNTTMEGFVPRLTKGFNDVIDVVNGSNLDARDAASLKEQLDILTHRLHLVHQKHVNKLEKSNVLENISNAFDRANSGLVDKSGKYVNGIAKVVNEATKGHRNPVSKTMNTAAKLITANHLLAKSGAKDESKGMFLKSLNKILDSRPNREHRQAGFLRNLTNHVVGHNRMLESLLTAGNKIQQTRKSIETDTKVFLNKMFDKEGTYLTNEHKGAITQVFLRAGTHHLLESHGLKNISKLLLNKNYRESEIDKYIKELEGITQNQNITNAYLHMISDFGHRMVNGGNSAYAHSLSNVEGIARLVGINPKIARVSEEQALAVVPTLEKLVTLFALNETKVKDLKTAREVLNHEITHNQGLGIEQTLLLARGLEAESKQVLFKDDKLGAHMTTAYVPDQLDDRSDFIIAGKDEESKLLAMGYERLENEMSQDPSLPNREVQYMYVLRNGGSQKYVSQALSLTAKHHKGSAVFERNFDKNLSRMKTAREANIRRMFSTPFDPKVRAGNLERNWAIPLLTQNGNISNYRYEMKHSTKDSLFARNNDFGTLLGKYKASIYDKNASSNHNKEVADALLEDMKIEYPQYAESFIWIGVDSKDPSLVERYSLIPQETRNYLRTEMAKIVPNRMYEADGKTLKNGFLMRKDLVNITLGYRSPSLAEFLEASPENRNLITRAFVNTVEAVYGHVGTKWLGIAPEDAEAFAKRAIHHIRRGEDVVQAMMQEMKQWIVVKSGVVLLANIWSNTFLLVMNGMSIREALLKQIEGYKLLRDYKNKNQQAHTIHTRLSINPNMPKAEKAKLENELKVLGFALGNNPVQKLIHAGMMPTIVEDVSLEDDPYSVRNQFFDWVDEKTSRVPKPIKTAAKLMYMSQDTKLFKLLNDTTQYSDFVARYALFDYLTNKAHKPLSEEEAMNSAKDSFIVYDIALPKELQYLDNVGLSLFLKYALGIQRVVANLLTTKPLHVAKGVLIDSILDGFGTIIDSAWMFNGFSRNTINSSVLSVPGNIGTIGTVSFAEGLIK